MDPLPRIYVRSSVPHPFAFFLAKGWETRNLTDQALMNCNRVWVPHPRDAFVLVARVG
jgi:hypothetical protein